MLDMVGIIIINYNNWQDTINCINSLEIYNSYPIKIVVVDNGSKNESVESLNCYFSQKYNGRYKLTTKLDKGILPYISLVDNKVNEGYARGNNIGLLYTLYDESITDILILNNDILFVEDIIPSLLNIKKRYPDSAIITPLLLTKDGVGIDYTCARRQYTVQEEIIYNFLHYLFPQYVDKKLSKRYMLLGNNLKESVIPIQVPSGSCMLMDKAFFKSINFFDPNTFLYWEESILYEKIKSKFRQNYLNTEVKCIHLGGASTSKSVNSRFCLKCGNHSARYFMKNYSNCGMGWFLLFYVSTMFNNMMFEVMAILNKLKCIYGR